MSKTTFFKRIALTAVAALGLGMLSVAPSQAVAGTATITVTAGSASVTSGASNETTTAATVSVSALVTATTDTYSVSVVRSGTVPTGGSAVAFRFAVADTSTSVNSVIKDVATAASGGDRGVSTAVSSLGYNNSQGDPNLKYESTTTFTATGSQGYQLTTSAAPSEIGATFGILVDTNTTRVAGTYTFTVLVQAYNSGAVVANSLQSATVTFTINDTAENVAAASGTIDPSKTTAILNAGTSVGQIADSDTSVLATASNTTRATIRVRTYTSAGLRAPESVTVTITGPGLVGTSAGVYGKSITTAADGDDTFLIRSDGTAGTASIVVKTTTVTFPAKSISFYAATPSTITVSTYRPVIAVGSATSDVVRATIKDADGIVWGGTAYIYSADPTIASSATPAQCTFSSALGVHQCPVQGKLKGTANLKVIDASTVAAAEVTSEATSVRVSTGIATTATISFDKATYAPGEKAQLRVSILDQEGLAMPQGTVTAAFAAALVSNVAFGSGSDSLANSANIVLDGATSAASNTNAGHDTFIVYMPMQAGTVTVTGIGSVGLAASGRVAVSGSATVVVPVDPAVAAAQASAEAASDAALEAIDAANAATDAANLAAEAADAATVAAEEARDAADAATAAVEALAGEVATLMAALKAQITTLAKTVAKIAKKVKA